MTFSIHHDTLCLSLIFAILILLFFTPKKGRSTDEPKTCLSVEMPATMRALKSVYNFAASSITFFIVLESVTNEHNCSTEPTTGARQLSY